MSNSINVNDYRSYFFMGIRKDANNYQGMITEVNVDVGELDLYMETQLINNKDFFDILFNSMLKAEHKQNAIKNKKQIKHRKEG